MFSVCCVAHAEMVCDLNKVHGQACILRSPLIPDTFNWDCLLVKYSLTSDDVRLTVRFHEDDKRVTYTILLPNRTAQLIKNPKIADPNLNSSINFLLLRATRYLKSSQDYEQAFVSSVEFRSCVPDTGMCEGKFNITKVASIKRMSKYIALTQGVIP